MSSHVVVGCCARIKMVDVVVGCCARIENTRVKNGGLGVREMVDLVENSSGFVLGPDRCDSDDGK